MSTQAPAWLLPTPTPRSTRPPRGTRDADPSPRCVDRDDELDRLWRALRATEETTTLAEVARTTAHELDDVGARLESSCEHVRRCMERGEHDRVGALLQSHARGVRRLRELLLDLLDATTDPGVAPSAVDLEVALRAALDLLEPRLRRARVSVRGADGSSSVRAREADVVRTLVGVIDHALRATGGEGPIDIELLASGGVQVSDAGRSWSKIERAIELSFVVRTLQRVSGTMTISDRETGGTCVTLAWRRCDARGG